MPKLKLGINTADAKLLDKMADENSFKRYTGEVPPAGVYKAVVKGITYHESKTGAKPMFRFITEINEPKGSPKAQYNGYAIFDYNLLPVDKSDENFGRQAGNTKQRLEAIAQGPEAWKGYQADDISVSKDETPKILAIGSYKHNASAGAPVVIVTKDEDDNNGERTLRISQYNAVRSDEPAVETEPDEGEDDGVEDDGVGVSVVDTEAEPDDTEDPAGAEDDAADTSAGDSGDEGDVEPEDDAASEPEDEGYETESEATEADIDQTDGSVDNGDSEPEAETEAEAEAPVRRKRRRTFE